ncbi:GNAT family N-acetyltransferase [Rhodococcus sp. NPDC127530]|uniref:GNAT family N-acetyltransferase n=1 Tax=unclassified Rhodococcus (in: high G+C Gram-positive bacteria) TaxID=192944 RepID=UPI00363BFCA6
MSHDSDTAYVATGEHFNLRPFGVPDIETVGEWFADSAFRRSALATEEPFEVTEALHALIRHSQANPTVQSWVMEDRTGQLAAFGNWKPDFPFLDVYEIDLVLNPSLPRGMGYGTEACKLLVAHLFHTARPHKVFGRIALFNEAMRAVAAKAGTIEGCLRQHAVCAGQRIDLQVFGILRSEWESTVDCSDLTHMTDGGERLE